MAKGIKIDFSGVEDKVFGDYLEVPGTYTFKITDVEKVDPEDSTKYPYLKWTLEVIEGEQAGCIVTTNTSLKADTLFNLRNFLVSCGMEVPKSSVSINFDTMIGKYLDCEIVMRPYNGKDYANVKRFMLSSKSAKVKRTSTVDLDEDAL